MQQDGIALVAFDDSHLDGALRLSQEAGWPHRREEWAMLLALGQGFVALDGATVVGTAILTPFGSDHAAISMVIVAGAMRGRGLGRQLMDKALRHAGRRECRLTATAAGLPLYEKLGFRATHEIRQHQGVPTALPEPALPDGLALDWAGSQDLPALAALDAQALGLDRRPLLRLLAQVGRVVLLRGAGRIAGYGVLRRFGRGEVIGPVVAASPDQARCLLSALIGASAGGFLRVDTPEWDVLSPWLAARGLVGVGGGIAMRRQARQASPTGPAKPFALASQGLG